jgi:hypothetical protein
MTTTDTQRQLEQLDELERRANEIIQAPHYHMHNGQPVPDPDTGQPLRDDQPVLTALDTLARVHDIRARILGLYAPQRHELVRPDGTTIDITHMPELRRLLGAAEDDTG